MRERGSLSPAAYPPSTYPTLCQIPGAASGCPDPHPPIFPPPHSFCPLHLFPCPPNPPSSCPRKVSPPHQPLTFAPCWQVSSLLPPKAQSMAPAQPCSSSGEVQQRWRNSTGMENRGCGGKWRECRGSRWLPAPCRLILHCNGRGSFPQIKLRVKPHILIK